MRILLVGSHGTGKSTLAKDIQKVFPSFHIVDNIHRKAKEDGFQINKTNDVVSQMETVQRYLQQVRELRTENKSYITVNGIIRQTAYAICNELPAPVVKMMKELCYLEEELVDLVIYHSIAFPLEEDKVRDTDKQFQAEVDYEIQKLLTDVYVKQFHTAEGDPEKRAKCICNLLRFKYRIRR